MVKISFISLDRVVNLLSIITVAANTSMAIIRGVFSLFIKITSLILENVFLNIFIWKTTWKNKSTYMYQKIYHKQQQNKLLQKRKYVFEKKEKETQQSDMLVKKTTLTESTVDVDPSNN